MRSLLVRSPSLLALAVVAACTTLGACAAPDVGEAEGDTESDMAAGGSGNAQVSASALHVRSAPNSTSTIVATLAKGTRIQVDCVESGESVNGDASWDYVSKYKGYVSDAWVTKLGASFPKCGDTTSPSTTKAGPSSVASPGDDDLVAEARKWDGTHETGTNCNPFSSALGRPCEAWCADFVEYVWQQGGMSTDGVTAYAGSFLTYGQEHGTFKPRDSSDVQPGDAVVWGRSASDAAHVAMVTEVLANGDVRVMNGNWSDRVEETTQARSSQVSGYAIAGFVSPVAQ